MTNPTSRVLEVADALEANEVFQRNGWTDGLPIIAPTEDAVARFLAVAGLAPITSSAPSRCGAGGSPPRRSRSPR